MLVIPVCYVRCMINTNHSVLVAPTGTSGANKFPPVNNVLGEPAEFIPDLPSFISSSTCLLQVPVVCLFYVFQVVFISKHHMEEYIPVHMENMATPSQSSVFHLIVDSIDVFGNVLVRHSLLPANTKHY